MSKVTEAMLQAAKRRAEISNLLDEFNWQGAGYADKWEWLKKEYGPNLTNAELVARAVQDIEDSP
jgi:hypothetical protein